MKVKLIFKEYSDDNLINSFKRIANLENNIIDFKSEYNDMITINLLENSLFIKREGVINYLIKHEKNKEEITNIYIDGLGIKENIKVRILTKDLEIIKNSGSILIKINYKKDNEDISTIYEIIWRKNE